MCSGYGSATPCRRAPAGTPLIHLHWGGRITTKWAQKSASPGFWAYAFHQMHAEFRQAGVSPPSLERLHPNQTKEDRI
jgi:hypothetical protein